MKVRLLGLFILFISLVSIVTQKGFAQEPGITPTPQKTILTMSTTGETLIVPFVKGTTGVKTNLSYTGTVTVTVTGSGQASGPSWSDAFYIYTAYSGQPIVPVHPTAFYNWTLWINGGPADNYVNPIPAYNPNHAYTFVITAPGGPLTFAVGDTNTSDNAGAYRITVGSMDNLEMTRITLPVKWCALAGSPAASDTHTLALRTQQIINHIYLPKADISFQSGVPTGVYFEITGDGNGDDDGRCEAGEACSSAFPVISDTNRTGVSNLGDVQINTQTLISDELNRINNICFDVWNFALSNKGYSASPGIIAVNIRRFVDHNGDPVSVWGTSAIGSSQSNIGVVSVVDNVFTKGVPWFDTKDIVLAHEMGHSLSLEQSPSHHHPFLLNLMYDTFTGYNLQTQLTRNASNLDDSTTQVGQMRSQARHYIGVIAEPQSPTFIDPPLGDSVFALAGNLPDSEAFVDLSEVGLRINQQAGVTTFYSLGFGPFPDDIHNLNYMFLLDSDGNPNTGASAAEITSEIGTSVTFTGAEYLLQVEVDIINKSTQVTSTVKQYQTGTFITLNDPSIQAQASEVVFEPWQVTVSNSDNIIQPQAYVILQMNSGLIPLAVSPRLQGVAQNTNTQVMDVSDIKKLSFNMPVLPNCVINPTQAETGDEVVIIASNLPSRSTGQVILDNQVVATKAVDALGNVTIPFVIPGNTLSGIQIVNVMAENTAIAANCYLSISGSNQIYLPVITK
jgi:hypothetical protein